MKPLRLITICFAAILLTGCGRTPNRDAAERQADLPIEEWLARDAAGCLKHLAKQYKPCVKAHRYDSLAQVYERAIRALPEHPTDNADSIALYAGRLMWRHYNLRLLQRKLDDGSRLTDSLLRSRHAFYTGKMRPELLTYTAQWFMIENRDAEADSLGKLFADLPPTGVPARDLLNNHLMAWVQNFCSSEDLRCVQLQERAVEAYRQGGKMGEDGMGLSRMSFYYRIAGRYEDAARLIQESIDWCDANPGHQQSAITCYSDFASLYAELGLYDKALEMNAHAIRHSVETDSTHLTDLYLIRASCHLSMHRADSSFAWIDSAEAVVKRIEPDMMRYVHLDRACSYLESLPDTAVPDLDLFHTALADTARLSPQHKTTLLYIYGTVLTRIPGREREGIALLERGYRDSKLLNRKSSQLDIAERMLAAYTRHHRAEKMRALYPEYALLRDSLQRRERVLNLTAANIRYETGRKEQENRALAAEVRLKKRTLALTLAVTALLVVLLAAAAVYIVQRRRNYRRHLAAHTEELTHLLNEQQQLNLRNETLVRKLTAMEHTEVVKDVLNSVNLAPLSAENEIRFRRAFNVLYPKYLLTLHRQYPALTKTDDLLCMLIYLGKDTKEISLTMGIAKESVLTSRSRLRKKLGLEKDESLEEWIGLGRKEAK